MCGICGIIHPHRQLVDKGKLAAMNEMLFHRGPDSHGMMIDRNVGFAMRRLKIIDLKTGDQPISNEDSSMWIIFNGEIYNFHDIRTNLEKKGHKFRTKSDTECILHLYEEKGPLALNDLRGMFAIAIWDSNENRLFIARDRFGQKPLYYTIQGGVFFFSSELPSLLLSLPEKPEIDIQQIDLYLALQYIPEPFTPYKNIFKLPAAHYLMWQNDQLSIQNYWNLNYLPKHQASEKELIQQLHAQIKEAVNLRLISEVPLGAHLSGGIDSSIIVYEMAQVSTLPVKTFSVGFEEETFSELKHARQVADFIGSNHTEFILAYEDVRSTFEKIIGKIGEPFGDPSALPLFLLSKLTRQYVTVALNGDGGDESFAGYQRYWLDPYANLYSKLPKSLTTKILPALFHHIPVGKEKPIGVNIIDGFHRLKQVANTNPKASMLRWSSYFSSEKRERLWKKSIREEIDLSMPEQLLSNLFNKAHADTFLDRTLSADIQTYLPGDLLVKADRMTMAHSLEGRSPFLDHRLAEWAVKLPVRFKKRFFSGKYLLRKAYQDILPSAIIKRGKQGFGIPLSRWFREELYQWAREMLLDSSSHLNDWFNKDELAQILDEHKLKKADHGKRIWNLMALHIWASEVI